MAPRSASVCRSSEEDDGADDRAFDAADAADHDDEDDEGGPVVDAENAVSGEMRSFCRKISAPTIAVPNAATT